MGQHVRAGERDDGPAPRRLPSRETHVAGDGLRAVQRRAGNRAVVGTLQRYKGAATSFPGSFLRDQSYGSPAARAQGVQAGQNLGFIGQGGDIEAKTAVNNVGSTDGNQLAGQYYEGRLQDAGTGLPMAGQLILFFSGSHGAAEQYSVEIAKQYCSRGANVLSLNYRGFGGSTNNAAGATAKQTRKLQQKGQSPSEQNLYEDGMAMWAHAQTLGFAANKIILHGYSLGGSVATYVATEVKGTGGTVGGLVLHSSIANVKNAATGAVGKVLHPAMWLGGQLGHKLVGKMSTRQNLAALAAADQGRGANVPVHFMSGTAAGQDQLGDDRTGLAALARTLGFTDVSQTTSQGSGHDNRRQHMTDALGTLETRF